MAEKKHPIANPNDHDREELFRMWAGAYADTVVYVWADSFDDAFEELTEWLDDKGLCGAFAKLDESDFVEAAEEHGLDEEQARQLFKDPDEDQERFYEVLQTAEQDLTTIGHTTLTKCEKKLGGGPLYIPSHEWGGQEVHGRLRERVLARSKLLEGEGAIRGRKEARRVVREEGHWDVSGRGDDGGGLGAKRGKAGAGARLVRAGRLKKRGRKIVARPRRGTPSPPLAEHSTIKLGNNYMAEVRKYSDRDEGGYWARTYQKRAHGTDGDVALFPERHWLRSSRYDDPQSLRRALWEKFGRP